ncbi:MAG: HipA domain-containing protein, partial [Pseudomonadota bacterium]
GYAVDWAFEHVGARDAHAFSCRFPVGLEPLQLPHWPVFLIDMLPQGFGRTELLRRLNLVTSAEEVADWRLLMAGAGNAIGNLRVKEAAAWLNMNTGPVRGFSDDEIAQRSDDFSEYLASHGLFVAGSSGVQGEWPKILLTRAQDGLLYLDHTLPDAQAKEHFIVKFGRGTDSGLASILQHEAPYMALAKHLGLRVHAPLVLKERALFIPRFDRLVKKTGVVRLAQESIASLTGLPGFGLVPSHDEVCRQLIQQCTHPESELLEYIKRDVVNLALGNKDNHARNTALQRDFEGNVRLTPLYDFAPMYLHPDGIARQIRWEGNDGGRPDWNKVLDKVCGLGEDTSGIQHRKNKPVPELRREYLLKELKKLAPLLAELALNGEDFGMHTDVHKHLRPGIEAQVKQLSALS